MIGILAKLTSNSNDLLVRSDINYMFEIKSTSFTCFENCFLVNVSESYFINASILIGIVVFIIHYDLGYLGNVLDNLFF